MNGSLDQNVITVPNAAELGLAVLLDAVASNPAFLRTHAHDIAALAQTAGLELGGRNTISERAGSPQLAKPGEMTTSGDIFVSPWGLNSDRVYFCSATDFLKDGSGHLIINDWATLQEELSRRNGGRRYGDGMEPSLREAILKPAGSDGRCLDGDMIVGPVFALQRLSESIRPLLESTGGVYNLNNAPSKDIVNTIIANPDIAVWTCETHHNRFLNRPFVRVKDGVETSGVDFSELAVLPFKVYRVPPKAAVGNLII